MTVVDAAMPGFYGAIPNELAAMGRTLGERSRSRPDARALRPSRLCRTPPDRTQGPGLDRGGRCRSRRGRGESHNPTGEIRVAPFLGFLWLALRNGGLKRPFVHQVATYGDGATLDVPGGRRVTLVPGHTPGSAALEFAGLDAIFVGDALAT